MNAIKNKYYDGTFIVSREYEKMKMKKPNRNSFTLSLNFAEKRFVRFFFSSYPKIIIETCRRCMNCLKMCPEKSIVLKDSYPFARNKKCVLCYCCIEICPYKSIRTVKSIFEGVRIAG